jgi:hypothetical protein
MVLGCKKWLGGCRPVGRATLYDSKDGKYISFERLIFFSTITNVFSLEPKSKNYDLRSIANVFSITTTFTTPPIHPQHPRLK